MSDDLQFFPATGILINFKPVDIWTAIYIVHLLICLISEDNQNYEASLLRRNERIRFASFFVISLVLIARYALMLCLGRGIFYLDSSWAVWLGFKTNPTLYPNMGGAEYFLYDFVIVLVSFFYQRHLPTSSRFSCVSLKSKARASLLKEYAEFSAFILHNVEGGVNRRTSERSGTRRFSSYEIYRQFSLNYDRISAVVGLLVLATASIRSVPSLPSLIVICLFTAIIPQFDFTDHQSSRKRRKSSSTW
jgi:hypothetical protein